MEIANVAKTNAPSLRLIHLGQRRFQKDGSNILRRNLIIWLTNEIIYYGYQGQRLRWLLIYGFAWNRGRFHRYRDLMGITGLPWRNPIPDYA
jgi:hypothetical protein